MSFFWRVFSRTTLFLILALIFTAEDAGAQDTAATHKPKVIEFYANWCEPCRRQQSSIDRMKAEYGTDVEFVSYNVDDPSAKEAIEQYEVCPIPTVVFVDEHNQIAGYAIGCTQGKVLEKTINKMLTD